MSSRDLKRIALLLPNTDTILETDLQISLPSILLSILPECSWMSRQGGGKADGG